MEAMKMKNIKTFLPVFSGFYNTIWEFDYERLEYEIKEQRKENGLYSEIDFDDIDIDFTQYMDDIAKSFCERLQGELSDFVESITFENVYSPKAYNFSNDSVNVSIVPKTDNIKDFIYKHKEDFSEYLKNKYTSCDGFISYHANDFETWENETNNFTDFSANEHFLGSILQFICDIEDITEYNIFEYVEKWEPEYVKNWDEIINYTDGSLVEYFTKNGYNQKIAQYYADSFENNMLDVLSLDEKTLSIINEYKNQPN